MSKILFRVDANHHIGLGHLGRCLALADKIRERGLDPVFAMSRLSSDLARSKVVEAGYALEQVVAEVAGSAEDGVRTCEAARAAGTQTVVVDGYALVMALPAALRAAGLRVVCVDDAVEGNYAADLVVNPSLHGATSRMRAERGQALLGPRYALVRSAFLGVRTVRERRRSGATLHGMVCIGGTDPAQVSLAVLEALSRLEGEVAAKWTFEVLLAPGFSGWECARNLARGAPCAVSLGETVPELATRLVDVDFAIISASTTLLEVATVGIPAVAIAVADNQLPVAEAARSMGVALVAPARAPAIGHAVNELLADGFRREAMVEKQRDAVDGLGAERVADAITRL